MKHHNRNQQFEELLIKMDTNQKQSADQNLQKLAEQQVFQTNTDETTVDTLKTLKT